MNDIINDLLRLWHGWAAILALWGALILLALVLDTYWDRLFGRVAWLRRLSEPPRHAPPTPIARPWYGPATLEDREALDRQAVPSLLRRRDR